MYDQIKSHDLDLLKQQNFEEIQSKIKKREEDGYVSSKESSISIISDTSKKEWSSNKVDSEKK
jgi:hypothetical protein